MAEATTADDDVRESPKGSGDFLKTYVLVMAFIAAVLAVLYFKLSGELGDYQEAMANAPRVLGTPDTVIAKGTQRPTTIVALGVEVLKYLETSKSAGTGGEIIKIPVEKIQDRMRVLGLTIKNTGSEQTQPVRQRGYEETTLTVSLDSTDVKHFAEALYNLEILGTQLRVLEMNWSLRGDKENPYPPGDAILGPQYRIGYRKPISRTGG